MDDQADLLKRVVNALEGMGVPYMIGGSVALAVWAVPRPTHDLDLVVDLPEERVAEFCAYFPPERYFIEADAMRDAFSRSDQPGLGMYSFTDMDTGFKVDLFPLRPNDPAQQAALSRRATVEVQEGLPASVYAPDDLLVQKLRWYAAGQSERQFRDCLNLILTDLKRPTPLIARDYIESWATQLDPAVQQAWSTIKGAVDAANQPHDG